jgi:hypothetical protein
VLVAHRDDGTPSGVAVLPTAREVRWGQSHDCGLRPTSPGEQVFALHDDRHAHRIGAIDLEVRVEVDPDAFASRITAMMDYGDGPTSESWATAVKELITRRRRVVHFAHLLSLIADAAPSYAWRSTWEWLP